MSEQNSPHMEDLTWTKQVNVRLASCYTHRGAQPIGCVRQL